MYFAITKSGLHQSLAHLIYEKIILSITNLSIIFHTETDNINKTSFGLVIQESLKIIRLISAL